ncbi:uncharacterized protein Nmlp_2873 [Natronomonas moolapensis 8.8.11]|uniref:SnoaL-like domain-containing protein n=1 Tax=Natronomonas moolapensis (strain DSM 18674 / CECT 7526 / JCM 14361 / 8.8.11) TaxID=268739 RepID=M1Y3E4_NATM8|nr:nuclear transport factor 2 family protein [Natronomonas moolapensis]CCQ37023.1 uncharacterized protein Nmlp_2873 [Natronomonas moolapensis 8.8.11]
MDAEATVRAYYDALRAGDALAPFFARGATPVKFGIGERLRGFEEIEAGLAEQTETTDEWVVDSDRLRVTERDAHAWFSDEVGMAWSDLGTDTRYEFDTRWSGTLERRPDAESAGAAGTPWRFVGMHVSTPGGTR